MPPAEGQCRSAGGSPTASLGFVRYGLVSERSGAPDPMRRQFRAALAPGAAARRTQRLAGSLFARTPAEVGTDSASALGEVAAPGTPRPRLPHQSLDDGADCGAHRARVGSPLSSRSYRAVDAQPELESPETGASGPGARRTGDHTLEAEGLAPGKKTLRGWVPTSSSSMNPGSC